MPASKKPAKPSAKPFKPQAPAVSGTEGKPAKMHVNPPRLPSLQKHLKGMPMPIRVNVRAGMGAKRKGKA